MLASLVKNGKITRVMNAVAAGTTVQNSSILDMQGYEGVTFIAAFGALTATQVTSIKAQQDTAAAMGGAADLAGTLVGPLADGDGNKVLVLEVVKPAERYVRCVVNRATANAVIDGVIAVQWGAREVPTTHDTTVMSAESHVSPAEGTA